ncbi:MAG TPA: acylphosphatase [Streptosporangiaceae bacterium]|nr:acylphosphatase [Streptosporangiaceae bacterium]
MIRYRVLISGQVQGVNFRAACLRMALRHGVTGWVRNRADGTVEAVFEGQPDAVQQMVEWARRGPRLAVVTDVDVRAETPEGLGTFGIA